MWSILEPNYISPRDALTSPVPKPCICCLTWLTGLILQTMVTWSCACWEQIYHSLLVFSSFFLCSSDINDLESLRHFLFCSLEVTYFPFIGSSSPNAKCTAKCSGYNSYLSSSSLESGWEMEKRTVAAQWDKCSCTEGKGAVGAPGWEIHQGLGN